MTRSDVLKRWLSSTIAIALALAWLHRLGAGDLGGPPLSPAGAAAWLETRDTALAAFALLRLIALGFGWYLLMVTVVGGAARWWELPRVTSIVDRVTVPFARGTFGGLALLGVMTSPPPLQPQAPDSMIELPTETTTSTAPAPPVDDQATLHLLPSTPEATSTTLATSTSTTSTSTTSGPSTAPPTSVPPSPTTPTSPVTSSGDAGTWVIEPGESFWSVATEHLSDIHGRDVSDREVDPYWRQLVELNRSRLANPTDADLLFTGQVIVLPAVAPG